MNALALMASYVIVGLLNIVGEATGSAALADLTKPLLMPLLLAWLLVYSGLDAGPHRALRWLAIGVIFAWIGDLLLMGEGDAFFMGGLAAFLAMQVCYLLAFTRVPGPGLVRAWRITIVPYALTWILLNAAVGAGVGDLRIPVMIYSAVIMVMALAALDLVIRVPARLGWRVAGGALLFVLSDSLIAMTTFGPLESSRLASTVVMATYIAAQAMIVTGLTTAVGRAQPLPADGAPLA